MIVVDAGVVVTLLADDGPSGAAIRGAVAGRELAAPELIDLEVTSALRRLVSMKRVAAARADQAVGDLVALPLRRARHAPLIPRCWELRESLTSYDAVYVALAEALDARLLTGDARLARSPGLRCEIELVSPS